MIKLHLHVKQHPHVNRMRKRQRVVQLRNLRTNHTVELWYKAELLKLVRQIRGQTEAIILPMLKDLASQYTKDGYHSDFEDAFDRVSNLFGGLRQTAQRLAELAAQRSADQVDASLKAALQKSVSVDITSALSSSPIAAPMERAVVANIELIKSIPTKYLEKVKSEVYSGASQGMRWESIAEKVQAAGETTESRAKLIARDQVSKMNGAFNEARQTSLGIEKYIWQTSGDERVRDEHAQNDGKIFSWDDPPDTGHPGEDIQCRCVALPYFDLDAEEANLGTEEAPAEEDTRVEGKEPEDKPSDGELSPRTNIYSEWADSLTDSEKQACSNYWQGTDRHKEFNTFVRSYEGRAYGIRGEKMEAAMREMDSLISKGRIDQDQVLYRATQLPGIKTVKDLESLVGGTITDRGYMATTNDLAYAKRFSQVKGGKSWILEIQVKKGSSVANLDFLNPRMGEGEYLLPRNSSLRIIGVDKKLKTLKAELV